MIITLAHTKGGVGKSTLAWHLAHSIGHGTTVIDLDFQQTIKYLNLMGGEPLNVIQPTTSEELITFLQSISNTHIVIIDVGGFDNAINRTAIEYSDIVVIPISDSVTEVIGFETFKDILSEIGSHAEVCMVLNNVHPLARNFKDIEQAVEGTGFRILKNIIRSRKVYRTTMGDGKSVYHGAIDGTARSEISGLKYELIIPTRC